MAYSRRYFRFYSHVLRRDMEALHFGNWGYPLLIFPTSNGRFFDAEDRGLIASLRSHIDKGHVQVFCVETLDSELLLASGVSLSERRDRWLALERHWTSEFIPYIRHRAHNDFVVAAGCSLGATHALNLTLRHPSLVRRCLALGGPYDLEGIGPLWGHQHIDGREIYFINPMAYMANMSHERWLELGGGYTDIKLLSAHDDFCLEDHWRMARLLEHSGINHHLEVWNGGHDWPVWCAQIAAFA